jgi:hypothetical protein
MLYLLVLVQGALGMQVRLMRESWKNIQFFLSSFIVKVHTIINGLRILSILEPLGLESISSRLIIIVWILYMT